MTDIFMRNYRPSDIEALVALINTCHETDHVAFRAVPETFQHRASDRVVDPQRHHFVAEADGEIVGFINVNRELGTRLASRLWLHPAWRSTDLGRSLVESLVAISEDFPEPFLDVPVRPGEQAKASLLERELGFRYVRTWRRLRKGLAGDLPKARVPEGFTLRTFVAGQDEVPLTTLINDTFSQHWGEGQHTLEEVQHDVNEPAFDPGLLVLAMAGDEMVGYVWSWVNQEQINATGDACAFLGDLGVAAAYRRRGIGRALLMRALSDLQARGLAAAELEADGPNASAMQLYHSAGFFEKEELRWYRKELWPAGDAS